MKELIGKAIGLAILIIIVYFIATLFRSDPTPRGVPDDMVGNCTAYGDCY
ncbi:MAG: hypothetical protein NUV47_01900 [Patescibacteria group bacterium]|nr:hypothetical protein [Patescibacteria group bacterium]